MAGVIVGAIMVMIGGLVEYAAWLGSRRRLLPGADGRAEPALHSLEMAASGLGLAGAALCVGGLAVIVSGLDNAVGVVALLVTLAIVVASMAYAVVAALRARRTD